jgi:N-acetylglucosamine-6-phosphate deacetylase
MSSTWITNARVLCPGEYIIDASLVIEEGRIVRLSAASHTPPLHAAIHDAGGLLLTPGLIDIHTHGVGTCLYERSVDDLYRAAELLARFGTTCVLPTLYRVMNRRNLDLLRVLADALDDVRGVCMPGFHLEGPFLALAGAGAETVAGDVELLDEILDACNGHVLAMSISPDTPNILPVIERLREKQIVPFITHTRASAKQTQAAIDAGAAHATHFYDVFPVPEETEPGVRPVGAVEAALADERMSVDFICDSVHVSPFAIRAAIAAKGTQGVALITDSNIGAGRAAGKYETPWGFDVRVSPDDAARIDSPQHPNDGALAGSSLTMDRGMRNLTRWINRPAHEVWAMGTRTPARIVGLEKKGVIRPGADADLVLWDDSLQAVATWVGGELVFNTGVGAAR